MWRSGWSYDRGCGAASPEYLGCRRARSDGDVSGSPADTFRTWPDATGSAPGPRRRRVTPPRPRGGTVGQELNGVDPSAAARRHRWSAEPLSSHCRTVAPDAVDMSWTPRTMPLFLLTSLH